MKQARFIVNPISGVGRQKVIEDLVRKHIDFKCIQQDIIYTKAPGHATELAREAAREKIDIVIAVGGDGSVNEVGKGLIGTTTSMGIIPTGSGNGLARHLGIPLDLIAAMRVINIGNSKPIDTGMVNEHVFIGTAGVGFDAHIAYEFDQYGSRGFGSYIRLVIREYFRYRPQNYTIKYEDGSAKETAFLVCFANSCQWGNNACIAPSAMENDGQLDVCVLKPFPSLAIPGIVNKLFNGRINRSKYHKCVRSTRFTINNPGGIIHLDGEPLKMDNSLEVKVNPLSLNVVVPN